MTPSEITAHLRLIENQLHELRLHELRSRIESAPEPAPVATPDFRAALQQLADAVDGWEMEPAEDDPLVIAMIHARKVLKADEVAELVDKLRGDAECMGSRRDLMLLTRKDMLRIAQLLESLPACRGGW